MHVRAPVLTFVAIACCLCIGAADITLVKHARRIKPPRTSEYVVREGDTLRRILMEVYNAREGDLPFLYRQFRLLNPNVSSLDNILIGTKVRIPLVGSVLAASEEKKNPPAVRVKEVTPDEYVIRQGEHLAKILRDIYGIPDDVVYRQYIDLILKLNPQITNPDRILAGQRLRLPQVRDVLSAVKKTQEQTGAAMTETSAGVTRQNGGQEFPALSRSGGASGKTEDVGQGTKAVEFNSAEPGARGDKGASGKALGVRGIKDSVLPALKSMGGSQRDKGTFFMPVAGGTSLSINTSEIPVMELDTGRKIIFDMDGRISPDMKDFIEKAFPSFTVISGPQENLEGLMDRVLSVSGYFSINKDPSPLLVGSEEKLRFFGKWIVYKDFSRRNVFVINLLDANEDKTPLTIRRYAGTFGIDLIEIGGKDTRATKKKTAPPVDLKHSYPSILDHFKVPYLRDSEIVLMESGPIRVTYKAPILVDKAILTETMPDQEMIAMLEKKSYDIVNTRELLLEEVLAILGLEFEGPPIRLTVAKGRTELEIPGIRIGTTVILLKKVDPEIQNYLASEGLKLLAW